MNSYSHHCRACDDIFHPVYRKKHGVYEDLCPKCLRYATAAARTDEHLYKNHINRWTGQPSTEEESIIQQLVSEYTDVPDILADDPYYEYGEDAFGDLGLFDSYDR